MNNETRTCKICLKDLPMDNFTKLTSTQEYKKADGTVTVYKNTAVRRQCNSCLAKRYKKGKSKQVTQSGSIIVGGILVY